MSGEISETKDLMMMINLILCLLHIANLTKILVPKYNAVTAISNVA